MSHVDRVYSPDELKEMIRKMQSLSTSFYGQATAVGHHAFIEFCGLMNEYIHLCSSALAQNQDFTTSSVHSGSSLPMERYQVEYIAEKFECIFGPTFAAHPALAKVFVELVFPMLKVA